MSLALGLQAQLGGQSQLQRAINLLKSKGADAHLWDFSSFKEAYGAEFAAAENWNGATGDTVLDSGLGTFTTTSSSGYGSGCNVTGNVEIGKTYKLTFTILFSVVGSGVSNLIGSATATSSITTSGTYTGLARATTTGKAVIFSNGAGSTFTVSNVSVREVLSASPGTTLPNVLFQDSAGITPVTAPDQPIGLCLDSMGVLGSELAPASWSAYNATISGSTLPITATSTGTGNFGILAFPAGYAAGKKYKVSISWTANSAAKNVSGDASGVSHFGNAASGSATGYIDGDGGGAVYAYCFGPLSIGSTLTITAYSLKEISGIHASQATSAKKPTLRRGVVNRLTYSHDLSNVAWSKLTGVTVTGSNVSFSTGAYGEALRRFYTFLSGSTYTVALDLEALSGSTSGVIDVENVETGVVTVPSVRGIVTYTFTAAAQRSWLDIQMAAAASINLYGVAIFTGTLTASEILAYGGIPLTTSAPASSSQGLYWFDHGGDDNMLVGNVGFTNAATIVIAGRLDSLPAYSALIGEDTGGVQINVLSSGAIAFSKQNIGDLVVSSTGAVVAGTPFVITCRLSGGTAVIRKNGVQAATAGSAPSFVATTGSRIGSGFTSLLPITGALGTVIALPVALTDAELLLVEKLAASKAGIAI